LELHSVAAARDRDPDQLFRNVDFTVMVDANLRNDETGLIVADPPVADLDLTHG
jgi:hypothetical protein